MSDNNAFLAEFIAESLDHLQQAEACLLNLATNGEDRESVQSCFRSLHTVKGLAGFLSLDRIQALTHAAEQLLDRMRQDGAVIIPSQVDALLQAVSRVTELIDGLRSGDTPAGDDREWVARLEATPDADAYAPAPDAHSEQVATTPRAPAAAGGATMPAPAAAASAAALEALDEVLGRLLSLDAQDIPGLVHILAALEGLAAGWPPRALAIVDELKALGDRMILEEAPAGLFDEILSRAAVLPDILQDPVPASGAAAAASDAPAEPADDRLVSESQSGDFASETLDLLAPAEAAVLATESPNGGEIESVFRAFHTVKSMASYLELPRIEQLAHHLEDELIPVRDGQRPFTASVRSLVLSGIDALRAMATHVRRERHDRGQWPPAARTVAGRLGLIPDEAGAAADEEEGPSIEEVLIASGVTPQVIKQNVATLKPGESLTDRLVNTGTITRAKAKEVIAKQQELSAKSQDTFTRVSIGRLEELVDLVGELLIAQAMVTQDETVRSTPRLRPLVGRQDRIIRDLQNLALNLRMVPLKATFQKMGRAVHDTAKKLGKAIDLKLVGEDTEIDRTLAETLADPLLHMVRNAIDHGIEPAEERRRAGKPEKGRVSLEARQTSDHVILTLRDDGRGMDPARLIAKAVEKGLIGPEDKLTDAEAYRLIFAAGFSTAEQVTGISGRGVGMDVVRRNIESAKGRIDIESRIGGGSAFIIRLPLTTAILDGMLLRVGSERFLVPVTAIVASLRPGPGQVQEVLGRGRIIENRGELLPVSHLGDLFCIPDVVRDPTASVIMVLEHGSGRYAVQVDEILGLHQVVIKPLSHEIGHHRGLAGTAILGDGRVGLVIDPAHLIA